MLRSSTTDVFYVTVRLFGNSEPVHCHAALVDFYDCGSVFEFPFADHVLCKCGCKSSNLGFSYSYAKIFIFCLSL